MGSSLLVFLAHGGVYVSRVSDQRHQTKILRFDTKHAPVLAGRKHGRQTRRVLGQISRISVFGLPGILHPMGPFPPQQIQRLPRQGRNVHIPIFRRVLPTVPSETGHLSSDFGHAS